MSRIVLILAAWSPILASAQDPKLPPDLDVTAIRGLCLQHDGRWPPLDTVARDIVTSVTGTASFRGCDPVLWLLAWTFAPDTWMNEPLITIRNAELRRELQLSPTQTVFSYSELLSHRPLRSLIEALGQIERGRKMNPLESKVSDISDKLSLLQTAFRGQAIKLIPDPANALSAWKPMTPGPGAQADVGVAWDALGDAFRRGESAAFTSASDRLLKTVSALPAAYRPDADSLATELKYNQIQPFSTAWKVMLVGALLAAAAILVRRRWFDGLAAVGMIAGFGLLTYGLSLRWQIAGRIPASNMFESLLFLSWGMGAFAILSVFVFRDRLVPLTASGMGALALILADRLPLDHFIRPIAPVLLDTIWMSIHVPVIMISYSVLALAVLVAHAQLIVMAFAPGRVHWSNTIDRLHYWYVHVGTILLTAGIATGSMWAASSWGRYWGWDPKEVWSLVALLGYLTILHVRPGPEPLPRWAYGLGILLTVALLAIIVPKLSPMTTGKGLAIAAMVFGMAVLVLAHGPFAAAAKSIMCFWLIIMTYVGVNYVLGIGLHSYGFGTGAVVRYMFLTGGIELAFVALLSLVYWFRRPSAALTATAAPILAPA